MSDQQREQLLHAVLARDWQHVLVDQALLALLQVTCCICEQKFTRLAYLTRHLQQHHSDLWTLAANDVLTLAEDHKPDGTCFCIPANPRRHQCSIFIQLAMLQHQCDHQAQEAQMCVEDLPPALPIDLHHVITKALELGTLPEALNSTLIRTLLTKECIICQRWFPAVHLLNGHLTKDHGLTWESISLLASRLNQALVPENQCICNPMRLQTDHYCTPVKQIAYICQTSPKALLLPYRFTQEETDVKLAVWATPEQRQQILACLMTRSFADLFQMEWLPHVLSHTCILCGELVPTHELNSHLDEQHDQGHPDYRYTLPELIACCAHLTWDDDFCPLCQMQKSPQTPCDLHLQGGCPVLLQIALILLYPLHSDQLRHYWKMQDGASGRLRQLSLTEGFAWPLERPTGNMIDELTRMVTPLLNDDALVAHLRLHCTLCSHLRIHPSGLLQHLHHHPCSSIMYEQRLKQLQTQHGTGEYCALCSEHQHPHSVCPVLSHVAVNRSHGGRRRHEHARDSSRLGQLAIHGSVEPHAATGPRSQETSRASGTQCQGGGDRRYSSMDADSEPIAAPPRRSLECDLERRPVSGPDGPSCRWTGPKPVSRDTKLAWLGQSNASQASSHPAHHDHSPGTPSTIEQGSGQLQALSTMHGDATHQQGTTDAIPAMGGSRQEAHPIQNTSIGHRDGDCGPGSHHDPAPGLSSDLEVPQVKTGQLSSVPFMWTISASHGTPLIKLVTKLSFHAVWQLAHLRVKLQNQTRSALAKMLNH